MIVAVVDNNVVVSSIFWGGPPHRALKIIASSKVQAFATQAILEELIEVLSKFKYHLPKAKIQETVKLYLRVFRLILPDAKINAIPEDPDDNKFLECAVKARADFIITGDKHLLGLGSFRGIKIVTPSEFLKTL